MDKEMLLQKILSIMHEEMPDLDKKAFVADELAKAIFGEIPNYSTRKCYHVLPVNTVTVSSFIICYYKNQIVMIRKKSFARKTHFLGFLGGFINIDKNLRETPAEAAIREFKEECRNKVSAIIDFSVERLKILNTYIDYTKIEFDLTPTLNVAYLLALTREEFLKIQRHKEKMKNDKNYAAEVYKATDNEVFAFETATIANLLKRESDFAHKNEFSALKEFRKRRQTLDIE